MSEKADAALELSAGLASMLRAIADYHDKAARISGLRDREYHVHRVLSCRLSADSLDAGRQVVATLRAELEKVRGEREDYKRKFEWNAGMAQGMEVAADHFSDAADGMEEELAEARAQLATLRTARNEANVLQIEVNTLRGELHNARALAKVLAHSYEHDSRPPPHMVAEAMEYDATQPPRVGRTGE